jgi:hypothetical protein
MPDEEAISKASLEPITEPRPPKLRCEPGYPVVQSEQQPDHGAQKRWRWLGKLATLQAGVFAGDTAVRSTVRAGWVILDPDLHTHIVSGPEAGIKTFCSCSLAQIFGPTGCVAGHIAAAGTT